MGPTQKELGENSEGDYHVQAEIMAGRKEVRELSDDELLNELRSLNLNIGPISPTTRRIYEKKLSKARGRELVDSEVYEDRNFGDVEENSGGKSTDSRSLESPSIFYAVCFDVTRSSNGCGFPSVPVVFTSKEEALKAAKKFKGARFKAFKTRVEAEGFSRSQSVEQKTYPAISSSLVSPTDPIRNFKGPSPQELVKFRKVIEHGLTEEFQEIVFDNPRYMIGPGDTPVILQEGFRYNAIHVAASNNRKDMCQLIIDTLESQRFWNILLNQLEDSCSAINSQRRHFLVDMYLNTPEKGNMETPLHFACKYGHLEVVEYLVSHPLTDMQRTNKYGETPAQVICSRCSEASSEKRRKIQSYLEGTYYVPLLGSVDNSTPPWIGEPWSSEITNENSVRECRSQESPFDSLNQRNNPSDPPVTVRAYAGPMSPSKAGEFYHSWKTPPKVGKGNNYSDIKRKDDSRGVERIGRQLAHIGRIPWTEYWTFLAGYADLSNSQGMEKLENYLAKKKDQILFSRLSVTPQRVGIRKSNGSVLRTPKSRQSSVVLGDNRLLQEMRMNNQHDETGGIGFRDGHHLSFRKTLFSNSMESENASVEGKTDVLQNSKEHYSALNVSMPLIQESDVSTTEPVETLEESFDHLSLTKEQGRSEQLHNVPLTESIKIQHLLNGRKCNIIRTGERGVGDDCVVLPCEKKALNHVQETKDDELSACVPMETDTHVRLIKDDIVIEDIKPLKNIANEMVSSPPFLKDNCALWDQKESCYDDEVFENILETDASSAKQCHLETVGIGTPEFRAPVNRNLTRVKSQSYSHVLGSGNDNVSIFIQGSQPSKVDLDVLIAIGQTKVDHRKFPNIAEWKKLIMSYSEEKQQSWPSPGSPRYNVTKHKSLTWSC